MKTKYEIGQIVWTCKCYDNCSWFPLMFEINDIRYVNNIIYYSSDHSRSTAHIEDSVFLTMQEAIDAKITELEKPTE